MRYQVPQFVDIEDKIIGPFTLKQFLMYLGAALSLIPLYMAFDLSLFVTIALPIVGVAVAFAHLRFHGKSLFSVISNALRFAQRGQLFLWRRSTSTKSLKISGEEFGNFSPEEVIVALKTQSASLALRAQSLETQGKVVTEDMADPFAGEAEA